MCFKDFMLNSTKSQLPIPRVMGVSSGETYSFVSPLLRIRPDYKRVFLISTK